MNETTVREMRARFSGQDAFVEPVEVRSFGRHVGTWFPPGTISDDLARELFAAASRRRASLAKDQRRLRGEGVSTVPPEPVQDLPAPPVRRPTALDRQRARDEILKSIVGGRGRSVTEG